MITCVLVPCIVTSLVLQFIAISQGHFPEKVCDWEDQDLMGNRGLWEPQSLLTLRTRSFKKHRKILLLC